MRPFLFFTKKVAVSLTETLSRERTAQWLSTVFILRLKTEQEPPCITTWSHVMDTTRKVLLRRSHCWTCSTALTKINNNHLVELAKQTYQFFRRELQYLIVFVLLVLGKLKT